MLVKQAGLSFTSTSLASAFERFADDQIMGKKSYVSQMERQLRQQGDTPETARGKAALWNYIALPAMNGSLGALSSVVTSVALISIAGLRGKYAQTKALDDQLGQIQQNQQGQAGQDQNQLVLNPADDIMNNSNESLIKAPKASDLKNSQTVQRHLMDIIEHGAYKGEKARPFVDTHGTTMLVDGIMQAGQPIKDRALANGVRWEVPGSFRGTQGVWQLVIDLDTNTIVHFNFVKK